MILNKKFKLRLGLILAFFLFFITYQYSGLRNYLTANNITYRVQISAAYQNPIPIDLLLKKFAIDEKIREDYHKGWFKYSIGSFADYYDARSLRDKLISENKTYGAFVVLIKDDIRMDGMDTIHSQNTPSLQSNQKVSYKIQIKASDVQLSVNDLKTQLGIAEDITEETNNKWFKYTIGNFENYEDVKNLFYRIKNIDKISDAFIVTYYGNKRIGYNSSESKPRIRQTERYRAPQQNRVIRTESPKPIQPVVVKKNIIRQQIVEKPKPIIKEEVKPEVIENKKFDIILFHVNSEKLIKTKRTSLQEPEIQQEPKADTNPEIENQNQTPVVVSSEPRRYDRNTYYYSDSAFQKERSIKKSFFKRFIESAKTGSKRSFFIWTLIVLTLYFIVNLIVVIAIVFISRIRKTRKENKIKKTEEDFQMLLAEYLFDTSSEKEAFNSLKNTTGAFKRNILLEELMKLSVDLSGEVLEKLKILYFKMELDKDSMKKLDNRRWFVKVKGCRELTRMKTYHAKSKLEKLLNSKNEILRAEAQMALIELSEDNPYYFLEKLTQKFLPWEQLNVHVMMQRNSYEIPDFSKWLMVDNETVILFAIEMIRVYRQIMNAPKIMKFFNHPNPSLKEASIIAAGELGYVEVVPEMIKIYNIVDDEYKVLILRAMQKLADDGNKDFLRGILESDAPQHIKLDAAKAMFALGIKGQIELKRFSQTSDNNLNAIIKHVFDERI